MTLNVNGIEPKSIKVNDNGRITDLTNLQIYQNGEIVCNWKKTYTLSISKGSHSTVSVASKYLPNSLTILRQLSDGSAITHGTYLDITVTGQQGYNVSWKLNGVTQSSTNVTIPVDGDVNIVVTETYATVSLDKPVISGTYTFESYGGFYSLDFQIKNYNSCAVTASVLLYSNGDHFERAWSVDIPANSTVTYPNEEIYSSGVKVQVTFSCSGYGDSSSSETFGDYPSSGNVPDDETTTTTP